MVFFFHFHTLTPHTRPLSAMPYSCTTRYPKGTTDVKLRVKSCTSDPNGIYESRQPCVEDCWYSTPPPSAPSPPKKPSPSKPPKKPSPSKKPPKKPSPSNKPSKKPSTKTKRCTGGRTRNRSTGRCRTPCRAPRRRTKSGRCSYPPCKLKSQVRDGKTHRCRKRR